jgi:hypothetical protein
VVQKVQTLFIDNIDGSAAEGAGRLGLDGTEHEIDLNAGHGQQLRDALAAYGGLRNTGTGACTPPWSAAASSAAPSWSATSCASWAWSRASRGRGGTR